MTVAELCRVNDSTLSAIFHNSSEFEEANLTFERFAASMDALGFEESQSDAAPIRDDPVERTPAEKKQAARQHAKQYRKDRRGERRTRTTSRVTAKKAAKKRGKSGPKPKGRGR